MKNEEGRLKNRYFVRGDNEGGFSCNTPVDKKILGFLEQENYHEVDAITYYELEKKWLSEGAK